MYNEDRFWCIYSMLIPEEFLNSLGVPYIQTRKEVKWIGGRIGTTS